MVEEMNMPLAKVKNILYKESGMLGLSGSSDARDVAAKYYAGDRNAAFTQELYGYRIRKYIGAYMAALNGVDALIFTAGLGENSVLTRSYACKNLENLGIELNEELNDKKNHPGAPVEIQTAASKVKILIVPTNEEWQIAKEVSELVKRS
jgi:acetate kinase